MKLLQCLLLLCAFVVQAYCLIVTPFTNCTSCYIYDLRYPSPTEALLLLSDSRLYRSTDEGQHWTNILNNTVGIYAYDNDPRAYLFWINSTTFYRTTDGGRTVTLGSFPRTAYGLELHPYRTGWLFFYYYDTNAMTLGYSKDFGVTWNTTFKNQIHLYAYYYYSYSPRWSTYNNTPDTIFAVRDNLAFAYSTNYSTWVTLYPSTNGFIFTNHFLFMATPVSAGIRLHASPNRLDPSHYNRSTYFLAEFPFGDTFVGANSYTFLDDSTRSELIVVQRNGTDNFGTVFSSEFDGDSYTLTLSYLAGIVGAYDFDDFAGLPGIYLANVYGNSTGIGKRTVISFDNGGDWRYLTPPATNYSGSPVNCSLAQGCSLNVHGLSSYYTGVAPPFWANENAIGLMVAIGSIGTAVSNTASAMRTYFTRDAGLTWSEIYNESTIWEFGDHGGIFVFTTTVRPTTTLYFSLDEGATVTPYVFTNTAVYVYGILTDPTGTGRKFILFGYTYPGYRYVVFGLDFSDTNIPVCQNSDYETWSPSDGQHPTHCFLGQTTTYLRRKQFSQCYNDRNTDHVLNHTSCICNFEDYECDIGFSPSARNATDGFTCKPDNGTAPPSCASGYRLVPDTNCTLLGGLDLNAHQCPGYSAEASALSLTVIASSSTAANIVAVSTSTTTVAAATSSASSIGAVTTLVASTLAAGTTSAATTATSTAATTAGTTALTASASTSTAATLASSTTTSAYAVVTTSGSSSAASVSATTAASTASSTASSSTASAAAVVGVAGTLTTSTVSTSTSAAAVSSTTLASTTSTLSASASTSASATTSASNVAATTRAVATTTNTAAITSTTQVASTTTTAATTASTASTAAATSTSTASVSASATATADATVAHATVSTSSTSEQPTVGHGSTSGVEPSSSTSSTSTTGGTAGSDSHAGLAVGLTLTSVVVVGAAGAGVFFYKKNPRFRSFVTEKLRFGRKKDDYLETGLMADHEVLDI